jgi:predicted transcriptional regulator
MGRETTASHERASQAPMLDRCIAQHFRDQLKAARANAFRDAEGFQEILFVIERLGFLLTNRPKALTLGDFKPKLEKLSEKSSFANEIPERWRLLHTPIPELYEMVRIARNDALHQGAFARHLTVHAVELALILEDALMDGSNKVSDFMIRNVVVAQEWQPISFVRQEMLVNSYSYIPLLRQENGVPKWYLISDYNVARCIPSDRGAKKDRYLQTIKDALGSRDLVIEEANLCEGDTTVEKARKMLNNKPLLITHKTEVGQILGIITAFDLL